MIALIGFMGAGKTTVGRLLADRLGLPFADSDVEIERQAGRPIRDIFAVEGEPAFRDLEHRVVADLLGGPDMVLALGGGAPEYVATRKLLAESKADVVYLRVGLDEALARVAADPARPLLAQPGLAERYQRRLSVYASAATLTVDTSGKPPADVAEEIDRLVTQPRGADGDERTHVSSLCPVSTYSSRACGRHAHRSRAARTVVLGAWDVVIHTYCGVRRDALKRWRRPCSRQAWRQRCWPARSRRYRRRRRHPPSRDFPR